MEEVDGEGDANDDITLPLLVTDSEFTFSFDAALDGETTAPSAVPLSVSLRALFADKLNSSNKVNKNTAE